MKDGWKSKTWANVCETDGAGAEAVMDEAASRPELIVFAQGGGYWAMLILADQTQKSVKRKADAKTHRDVRSAKRLKTEARSSTIEDEREISATIPIPEHDTEQQGGCEKDTERKMARKTLQHRDETLNDTLSPSHAAPTH